ncbi:MAG: hypothetical protein A2Y03_09795 [Omnitrophica WOR_2 bacterium GWF2_38_59]|nr:MAG: hypothetical protein A2Y03_09795 [Omnitrophica WOR_2 bacterium GWF2_38_59]OGX50814.1 MAG: hypothetical protein A2243_05900 [Omnitrophica WOR_2 bacterium RIFOXYA2_FULL_38_17]OGX52110.1 MAG: hypothetical protein A2267_07890 [Omnitrophica WOR_2 bacterium RIFOXYA12_FULL_38_10]OGX57152.1 MAG: hypothetical protein A2447_09565 [Omnitrophica WOR_2 bacterium RIFOXYC2_FULL_38_12]OGX59054.1 MAG: hypothetical protein A2306_03370 [Omnitrophica WOR_2 bacterium RIFOXYB2_FULL_38_16]HBG60546.1 hypothet
MFKTKINVIESLASVQADKILLTFFAMLVIPILFHMIPSRGPYPIGAVWLPIFYAPLFSSIVYKRHVAITSCIISPWINTFFTGMPRLEIASKLSFELIVFAVFAQIIFHSKRYCRFVGFIAFVFAKVFSYLIIYFLSERFELSNMFSELTLALPGIFVLLIIGLFSKNITERLNK